MFKNFFKRNSCNCRGCQITRSGHGFQPCSESLNPHQPKPPPTRKVRNDVRPPPPPPPPPRTGSLGENKGFYEVHIDSSEPKKKNNCCNELDRIAAALERIAEELKEQRTRRPPWPP